MSGSGASAGPGWFHAEGDPPGTQRYWDGSAWQGGPQAVPSSPDVPPPGATPVPSSPYTPQSQAPSDFSSLAAPTVEKRRSRWKLVIGIIVGFMLLIGGCTFILWRAVSGPIDAGNEFLAAVQAKDFERAWELSDASCFDGGSEVIEDVFGPLVIESYRLSNTNVQLDNGVQSGSTSGDITFGGGDSRTIDLFMVERNGWLVCGFDIGAGG